MGGAGFPPHVCEQGPFHLTFPRAFTLCSAYFTYSAPQTSVHTEILSPPPLLPVVAGCPLFLGLLILYLPQKKLRPQLCISGAPTWESSIVRQSWLASLVAHYNKYCHSDSTGPYFTEKPAGGVYLHCCKPGCVKMYLGHRGPPVELHVP